MTTDHARPALLVMDYQNDILAMLGERTSTLLERTSGVIAAARKAQVPIIYVVVGFRPGYPEVSPRNPSFSAITKSGRFIIDRPGADIATAVAPEDGEVVVVKRRVGAFSGSDLEIVLRAKGIDTLVLAGISTSGVVLSTVRHAADLDYRVVVLKDCCADADEEVHRVLTEKVFLRQTTATTGSDWVAGLSKS